MANPLQWMQSATPTDAWSAPQQQQQQPDYQSALSQAWHASYSKNNPMAYEQNYGGDQSSPYYAEGENQIVDAFARRDAERFARRAMTMAPEQRDAQRQSVAGAAMTFAPQAPLANALMSARQGDWGDAARSGTIAALGAPGYALNALGSTLAPTPTQSEEMERRGLQQAAQQIAPAPTVATPEETAELGRLKTENDKLRSQKETAIGKLPMTRTTEFVNGERKTTRAPDPSAMSGLSNYDESIKANNARMATIQAAIDERGRIGAPFAEQHPGQNQLVRAAPGVSLGTGALLGLLAGGRNASMLRKGLTYLGGSAVGGVEGAAMGGYPTYNDLSLPPGSRGRTAAENALKTVPEAIPDWAKKAFGPFLTEQALQEAGPGMIAGLLGTHWGMLGRSAGEQLFSRGGSNSNALASPTTSAELPQSWAPTRDASGRFRWPKGHPYAGKWAPTPKD